MRQVKVDRGTGKAGGTFKLEGARPGLVGVGGGGRVLRRPMDKKECTGILQGQSRVVRRHVNCDRVEIAGARDVGRICMQTMSNED